MGKTEVAMPLEQGQRNAVGMTAQSEAHTNTAGSRRNYDLRYKKQVIDKDVHFLVEDVCLVFGICDIFNRLPPSGALVRTEAVPCTCLPYLQRNIKYSKEYWAMGMFCGCDEPRSTNSVGSRFKKCTGIGKCVLE